MRNAFHEAHAGAYQAALGEDDNANAMPRDIERGMTAGFADYLTKPLDIGRFLASVDAHLPDSIEKQGNDRQA
ncbi:hypothetical protein [Phytopseudomonas daroniae]|uniref:hypothetical protein n=1 Tax=Phytopseudomonas daroniae TaxID=2487519 RepID=UPI00103835C7|nr:hypothetical protein [Pseudomonas daroniae]